MNDLLVCDRNATSMCDSWMVLVCAIVAIGWHKSYCNKNFNCPQRCIKQLQLFFWKMFKIQDQLVYVKLVHAQKLGPYLLMFVNLNLGVNPDVAYVNVRDGTL
jgi:hypothetical protein